MAKSLIFWFLGALLITGSFSHSGRSYGSPTYYGSSYGYPYGYLYHGHEPVKQIFGSEEGIGYGNVYIVKLPGSGSPHDITVINHSGSLG